MRKLLRLGVRGISTGSCGLGVVLLGLGLWIHVSGDEPPDVRAANVLGWLGGVLVGAGGLGRAVSRPR